MRQGGGGDDGRGAGRGRLANLIRRRFTDIWHEIEGAWKLVVRQATNIPFD